MSGTVDASSQMSMGQPDDPVTKTSSPTRQFDVLFAQAIGSAVAAGPSTCGDWKCWRITERRYFDVK